MARNPEASLQLLLRNARFIRHEVQNDSGSNGTSGQIAATRFRTFPGTVPVQWPDTEEIHVWVMNLRGLVHELFLDVLSRDESSRAVSFRFERDRARFVLRRAALRLLAARYTRYSLDSIRFCFGTFGKPSLAFGSGEAQLHFNASSSEEIAVLAFSTRSPLGIDVESYTAIPEAGFIKAQFLRTGESNCASIHEAFLKSWTRHEAGSKLRGIGIMKDAHANTGRTNGAALFQNVHFVDLPFDPKYICTLCYEAISAVGLA